MSVEFDIKLTSKDMYRFNMYQAYSGFQGWFSIFLAFICFLSAVVTFREQPSTKIVFYLLFGIILLLYLPGTLWLRSKQSMAASEILQGRLHYLIDEEGIHVTQGEAEGTLPWNQVYKMVANKHNVLIYSTRINAYIIPRDQLSGKYGELAELAKTQLPKYRVKMKA